MLIYKGENREVSLIFAIPNFYDKSWSKRVWRILLKFLLFITLILLLGCSSPNVYINGEEKAVGAKIYVDGEFKGEMEEWIHPKSKKISSMTVIEVSNGEHMFTIINKEGKILEIKVNVRGEAYISLGFDEMIIGGG